MKSLNRIVTMYLDYAEDQAERRNPMYMKDWEEKLNAFLKCYNVSAQRLYEDSKLYVDAI